MRQTDTRPALAALTIGVLLANPLKLIPLFVATVALAYFVGHTVHSTRPLPPTSTPAKLPPTPTLSPPPADSSKVPSAAAALSEIRLNRMRTVLGSSKITASVQVFYFGNGQPELADQLLEVFKSAPGWQVGPMQVLDAKFALFSIKEPLYLVGKDLNGLPFHTVMAMFEAAGVSAPIYSGVISYGRFSPDVTIVINSK